MEQNGNGNGFRRGGGTLGDSEDDFMQAGRPMNPRRTASPRRVFQSMGETDGLPPGRDAEGAVGARSGMTPGGAGSGMEGAESPSPPIATLADWMEARALEGGLSAEEAFTMLSCIATEIDKAPRKRFRGLQPNAIRLKPTSDGERKVPEIEGIQIDKSEAPDAWPYRAPESWKGIDDGARAAQFSLACILFEMLTGRPPAGAIGEASAKDFEQTVSSGVFRPVGRLSKAQNRALKKALSPVASARFASCTAMARAVRKGCDGRGWIPFAVAACVALAAFAAVRFWQSARESQKAEVERLRRIAEQGAGAPSQVALLEEHATQGDAEAMADLARRYAYGDGVEINLNTSLEWRLKAAEAGDIPSMLALGRACAAGDGVPQDVRSAAKWFAKAADAGDAGGRAAYAECLWDGTGVARNREEAFRLAQLALGAELPAAQRIAGLCYRDGVGTEADARKAARLLRDAAKQGDTIAQLAFARLLASGSGVAANPAEAISWAKKAAESGSLEAQVFVGECYAGGAATGTPDHGEAMRWYRMAAAKDYAPAQSLVGNHLVFGLGVEKNQSEGVKWLEKAAAQDYGLAYSNLARCYAEGWGVPKDGRKAADLLRKGAELGDPDSMGEYGGALVLGTFVARNPAEGLRWMTKAAETGRADMQLALANVLFNGLAGRVDEEAGMKWLEKAAASGLPEAQSQLAIRLQKGNANSFREQDARSAEERSFDLHLAAAKAGNVVSQSQVGTYYYNGYGCDRDYGEAFQWYLKAAEGGDDDAMVGVANCYDKGRGTPEDKKEALRWYKKAAQSSNQSIAATAKRAVARLAADGAGDASDAAAALNIFRERAEAGDILAMYDLAQRLDAGNGVKKDPNEAVKWWKRIAEVPRLSQETGALQIGAWVQYGVHLLDGIGTRRDAREAVKWLTKAAEDTDEKTNMGLTDANLKLKALACRRLAECCDKGDGVAKNEKIAFQWYQAGAYNGDVESCLETGDRLADGRAGVRDPMGHQRWYERAANHGSAEGAYKAGLTYAQMGAVWKNKARQWLEKADTMGHPKAKKALADLASGALAPNPQSQPTKTSPAGAAGGTITPQQAHNRGVAAAARRNFTEAAKWYRQAAEQGFGPSCANLGRMYYVGEGFRQDYAEAAKWYRKGAEAGEPVAQNGLAVCLLNGRGVRRDAAEAAKWFRRAAEQGDSNAQHSLGACYVNGDGVRKDYNEAIKWFRKAAAQGNAASKDALRQLGVR